MTRIAPLDPPYDDDVAEHLAGMMPPGVPPIALFRTFAKNLPMTAAMRGWGGYELGRQLSLSMRDREIVIDRTCARCACEYEWGVHVAFFADRVGLTREHVRSLTAGAPSDACWTDRDRLLIEAVDALHDTSDVDDALWARLAAELDEHELLDLLLLCGWYHAISFCARAARTPLEPDAPRFDTYAAGRSLPAMSDNGHPRHVDLSHPITDGMITYPGLPAPTVATHLSREAAEEVYGPGVTFHIGTVTMCTNTGTYLDVPFHRFADGHDLAGLDLERVAGVPAVCLDRRGQRAIDITATDAAALGGRAVLVRTDHSAGFGTPAYAVDHPFLTAASAEVLVAAGVACVGIDSLNIDDTTDMQRPVHTTLLRAGIPIVEHLVNLAELAPDGFTFTAVPPKIVGAGTFTVRAFATLG